MWNQAARFSDGHCFLTKQDRTPPDLLLPVRRLLPKPRNKSASSSLAGAQISVNGPAKNVAAIKGCSPASHWDRRGWIGAVLACLSCIQQVMTIPHLPNAPEA